jgi:hypothetical protein
MEVQRKVEKKYEEIKTRCTGESNEKTPEMGQ